VAYTIARGLIYARMKPLWVDELLTQVVCRQGSLRAIWKALSQGVDGQPPFFYLVERSAAGLIHDDYIGYRLLSVLGFACTLTLLYAFVKTRNGATPAFICTTLLLTTQLFTYYSAEARPYSMLTACIALALVCYQRAPAPQWVGGLFLSLLLASMLHYYAVFFLLPFFLAESTVLYKTKIVRYNVWLAMLVAPAPFIFSLPLLLRMKQQSGAHFWNQFYIGPGYGSFFGSGPEWGTALTGTAIVVMLVSVLWTTRQPEDAKGSSADPVAERVLILSLILLPMIAFTAARLTHAPFVSRYFLPAILGITAAVGYVLARAKPTGILLIAIFLMFFIGVQELLFWKSMHREREPFGQLTQLVAVAHREKLPIVVSDFNTYVQVYHYAPPELRQRILTLVDPGKSWIYTGTDTAEKIAVILRSYAPLTILDFAPFAANHPVFLLYSNRAEGDWWPARLLHDGHRLQLLAVHGDDEMYLVELKAPPTN
jgi:4-amino-4-deoxy-L-arabinose transferase-like glycosyltransferase